MAFPKHNVVYLSLMGRFRLYFFIILALCLGVVPAFASVTNIVILSTHKFPPYSITKTALTKVLKASLSGLDIHSFVLTDWDSRRSDLIDKIEKLHPDVVVTLGTLASEIIRKNISRIPQVFGLVVDPWLRGLVGDNITGVCLRTSVLSQVRSLVRIAHVKRVGLIWTKGEYLDSTYSKLQKEAKELGIQLVIITVSGSDQLPWALNLEISRGIDGFVMVADPKLFNNLLSVKYVLMQGLKFKIAVMGLAACYVKHGALAALQPDYKCIGVQVARLAIAAVIQNDVANIPIEYPGNYKLYINLTTANDIGIKIPVSVLSNAILIR